MEHELFTRHYRGALDLLSGLEVITYKDFLAVHRMLFSEFYPWAGADRAETAPSSAISKAGIAFSHPQDCRRAVEAGLRLGHNATSMNQRPGEVMGLFAYGHPFLDGNGRTMLLVHIELANRAGYSIAWERAAKAEYLDALGIEIDSPGQGLLDTYLLQFKQPRLDRSGMESSLLAVIGLDGLDEANQVDGEFSDPAVAERYRQFEERRRYRYDETHRGSPDGATPVLRTATTSGVQKHVAETPDAGNRSEKRPNGRS